MIRTILPRLIVGLLALLITAQLLGPAHARCAPKDVVTKHLKEKYGEEPFLTWAEPQSGSVGMLLTNPDMSTMTIVTLTPQGMMCLRGSGENMEAHSPVKPKPAGLPL